jgi:hypothetical protein
MVKKLGCVEQTDKKYLDRDSPPYPANDCGEGVMKKGNDGNDWYVVLNKNGVGRWVKDKKVGSTSRRKAPKSTRKSRRKSRKASKSRRKAPCPEGKVRNRETGRCRNKKSKSRRKSRKASKSRRKSRKASKSRRKSRKASKSRRKSRRKSRKASKPVANPDVSPVRHPSPRRKSRRKSRRKAPCPEGKVRNRETGRCRNKKSKSRRRK